MSIELYLIIAIFFTLIVGYCLDGDAFSLVAGLLWPLILLIIGYMAICSLIDWTREKIAERKP